MRTVDLVVVGSGAGGLAAALAGARAGLHTVVVEADERFGGSAARSDGALWLPGNEVLAEAGLPDTRERALAYLDAVAGADADRARLTALVDYGPAAVSLLLRRTPLGLQHMAEHPDDAPELQGGSAAGRAVEPKPFDVSRLGPDRDRLEPPTAPAAWPVATTSDDLRWLSLAARTAKGPLAGAGALAKGLAGRASGRERVTGGQALAAGLRMGLRRVGVLLHTSAPLLEPLTEGRRVIGARVRLHGRATELATRAGVVLAAGGLEGAAEPLGTARSAAPTTAWAPAVAVPEGAPLPLGDERALPGSLIVDATGRRIGNEAAPLRVLGRALHDSVEAGRGPAWLIVDQRHRNRYAFSGGILPHQALPEAWHDAGIAHTAASPKDLAAALGVPAEPLTATVERAGLLARHGHDDDFGRGDSAHDRAHGDPGVAPNPCLAPLEEPPLSAVRLTATALEAGGGLRTDEHARVVDGDGRPFDGLYATEEVAGVFGGGHPGPGATTGAAVVAGGIAAHHARGRAERTSR